MSGEWTCPDEMKADAMFDQTYGECKHGMNPQWCAECLDIKTPEEEQELLDQQMIKLAERFNERT